MPEFRYRCVAEGWRRRTPDDTTPCEIAYRNAKTVDNILNPDFVRELADCFGLTCFIETGTYRGDTLSAVRSDFARCISIELDPPTHAEALRRFAGHPNITLLNGDSAAMLAKAMRMRRDRPALIWLDAHFSGPGTGRGSENTPIIAEVETILANANPHDVVLVDDLRCFQAPVPGFAQDEGLTGYPPAEEIAAMCEAKGYMVAVMCDVMLPCRPPTRSLPDHPGGQGLHPARLRRAGADRARLEQAIRAADGLERLHLMRLPRFVGLHQQFGLGGDYLHWRALVTEDTDPHMSARDRAFAIKAGVARRTPS